VKKHCGRRTKKPKVIQGVAKDTRTFSKFGGQVNSRKREVWFRRAGRFSQGMPWEVIRGKNSRVAASFVAGKEKYLDKTAKN